jgi:hypothetical protein
MKRDMDLIRTIMLELERRSEPTLNLTEMTIEGYADDVVLEHLILLDEAGFIGMNVEYFLGGETPQFVVHRITWAGHEFLAAVRSDKIWAKATRVLTTAGIGFGWPVLQAVLRAKAAEHLGIQF